MSFLLWNKSKARSARRRGRKKKEIFLSIDHANLLLVRYLFIINERNVRFVFRMTHLKNVVEKSRTRSTLLRLKDISISIGLNSSLSFHFSFFLFFLFSKPRPTVTTTFLFRLTIQYLISLIFISLM